MAEKEKKRLLNQDILEYNTERLRQKQVSDMRKACRDTPEHFREMVQRAVETQMQAQEETGCGETQIQTQEEMECRELQRPVGRKWRRFLLPAAAIFAAGCVAAAAGSGWLKTQLLDRGFSESEAEVLIETEPQQQITELKGTVFPGGATKEKEWSAPLLTVREACFDGSTLYFMAEASKEAAGYDLYLRDHASVNGKDGITAMMKPEGEETYLGRIELWEDSAEMMQAEAIEVEMTVVPYPQEFEGVTLYTWKDAQAYEQIFGCGTFEDEYGRACRVISYENAVTGYTPQKLSVQVPLTEEAKQIIEKYRRQGRLEFEDLTGVVPEEEDSVFESLDDAAGSSAYTGAEFEENHVSCEMPGETDSLTIDAGIVQQAEVVYTGTLRASEVPEERLKALYTEGDPDQWVAETDDSSGSSWRYQDQLVFAGRNMERTWYQNEESLFPGEMDDTVSGEAEAGWQDKEGQKDEEEVRQKEMCREMLESLGIEVQITEGKPESDGTWTYYSAQTVLEDLPVAWKSQWNSKCTVTLENGRLAGLNAPAGLEVLEKEQVILPEMEEILRKVADYAAAGEIGAPPSGKPVTEISLEYYVDLTKQGLIFRPIWNFKIPYLAEGTEHTPGSSDYLYIDALTGALVRDVWGY